MDLVYIIKIEINLLLDIKTPVTTWILARLYNESHPLPSKDLVRQLCQASFDSMTGDTDYDDTIQKLVSAKYVEHIQEEYTDFITVGSYIAGIGQPAVKEVKKTREGYAITENGIIAFRRQIATPIEKIKPHIGRLAPSRTEKFKQILESIKSKSDLIELATQLCVQNAPLVIEFIKLVGNDLAALGISIHA